MVKSPSITSSDVSTNFWPVLKSRLGGLTFAEAPLSAISRFNWSPESAQTKSLFNAPRKDGSSFRADLEQLTPNNNPAYEIRTAPNRTHSSRGKLHTPLKPKE